MILPTKHTKVEQSLLGFGGYILQILDDNSTIDSIWQEYIKDLNNNNYPAKHSFDNLLLTLVFLFAINAIEEKEGFIRKCNY
ncbi:MAG: hypothetical protein KDK36_09400 [Leptospiraceae bacterium]|nr:hypothetical protein [Leptospiraceae bacterium]